MKPSYSKLHRAWTKLHAREPQGYLISLKAYCCSQFTHSSSGKVTCSLDGASSSLSLLLFKSCSIASRAAPGSGTVADAHILLICARIMCCFATLISLFLCEDSVSAGKGSAAAEPLETPPAAAEPLAAPPAVGSGLRRRRFGTVVSDMAGRSNEPHALLRFKGKGYGEIHQRGCSLWYAPVG